MFGLFKKKKKIERQEEKLEINLDEPIDILQDIFSYVNSHFDQKSNKISLKPQDYKNYYEHIQDPIEKTEVMILDYIGELEKKDRINSFKWSYDGLINGNCIYSIIKSQKYTANQTFSLDDITSALLSNEKDFIGDSFSSDEYGIIIVPHFIPINNLGFNRDLNKEETELVIKHYYPKTSEFDYIKDKIELAEHNDILYHKYWVSDRKKIQEFEQNKSSKKSRHITQKVKDKVWNRDGGKCVECGSNENLEFDHIIPHSKGGANTYRNIQLLCEPCNRSKSAKIG